MRVCRMTHTDMAESIEDAFMREDAIGKRQLLDHTGHSIEHSFPPLERCEIFAESSSRSSFLFLSGRSFTQWRTGSSLQCAHIESANGPMQAFQIEVAERFEIGDRLDGNLHSHVDQNLAVVGMPAQARAEIDDRAGRRIVEAAFVTDVA